MKDIIWTSVLAAALLLTVSVVRHELSAGKGENQHAASALSQTNVEQEDGSAQPSGKPHGKITPDERTKSKEPASQQVTVHSQAVGRKAEPVPVEPHRDSDNTFLSQITPEKLSQFQQSHEKKAVSGPDQNADIVEIDPAQLLQRLRGISEYQ